jgi:hypothetical protein
MSHIFFAVKLNLSRKYISENYIKKEEIIMAEITYKEINDCKPCWRRCRIRSISPDCGHFR